MKRDLCQRCDRGLPARHIARSDVLYLPVCDLCVLDALDLPRGARADDVAISPIGPERDPLHSSTQETQCQS